MFQLPSLERHDSVVGRGVSWLRKQLAQSQVGRTNRRLFIGKDLNIQFRHCFLLDERVAKLKWLKSERLTGKAEIKRRQTYRKNLNEQLASGAMLLACVRESGNYNKEKSSRECDVLRWWWKCAYAEGVRFISPGSRSAPWESEPKIALRQRRYTKTRDKSEAWIVLLSITPLAYRSQYVCTQGALCDPGLWNITPSAYPGIESLSCVGAKVRTRMTNLRLRMCAHAEHEYHK